MAREAGFASAAADRVHHRARPRRRRRLRRDPGRLVGPRRPRRQPVQPPGHDRPAELRRGLGPTRSTGALNAARGRGRPRAPARAVPRAARAGCASAARRSSCTTTGWCTGARTGRRRPRDARRRAAAPQPRPAGERLMGLYLLRRAGAALIVLLVASMLVFAGVRALPGDPALALAGEDRTEQALAGIRDKYGLDDPIPVQYVRYLGNVVQGDLGSSARTGLDVRETIVDRLPITLELAALSILVATFIGIGAGVVAAVRRGSPADCGGEPGRAARALAAELLARSRADPRLLGLARSAARLGLRRLHRGPARQPARMIMPVDRARDADSRRSSCARRAPRCSTRWARTTCARRAPRGCPSARSSACTRCATRCSR